MGETETQQKPKKKLFFGLVMIAAGLYAIISGIISVTDSYSRLVAPNGNMRIEIVDDTISRSTGLSGKENIDDSYGMLFVFDESLDTNCFWMKDMKFAIDMIWLNEKKEVITVTESVVPGTYPESFCPESAAKYGLEVKDGSAAKYGLEDGVKLRF